MELRILRNPRKNLDQRGWKTRLKAGDIILYDKSASAITLFRPSNQHKNRDTTLYFNEGTMDNKFLLREEEFTDVIRLLSGITGLRFEVVRDYYDFGYRFLK